MAEGNAEELEVVVRFKFPLVVERDGADNKTCEEIGVVVEPLLTILVPTANIVVEPRVVMKVEEPLISVEMMADVEMADAEVVVLGIVRVEA